MADLGRFVQKIFGSIGGTTEFGKIGSDAAGSPATTKDIAEIQSLVQYDGGLFDITADGAEPPRIQDINALYYLITAQLAYLFQKGMPEWHATEEYYAGKSFVSRGGELFACVLDNTGVDPATDDGTNWELIWDAARTLCKKDAVEYGHHILEIFPLIDRRAPATWNPANPRAYFPAVCLTDIDSQITLDAANAPDAVPLLRAIKMVFKDGLAGELAALSVTNWAIATNVATLTFTNNTDTIAALAALGEDQAVHGSYTNWRSITLASAIGSITAGDYAITNVNPSARTISFNFTAANGSGAVPASAEFFPFRIPGSTTTARIFTGRGLTLHGANDANGYFVSGGLRRRGYFQGHDHDVIFGAGSVVASNFFAPIQTPGPAGLGVTNNPVTKTGFGNVRFAAETHGPAMTIHLYMHLGRLI